MKTLSLIIIMVISISVEAQSYRVYFTDKGANKELLQNPYTFLSPKAIDNKAKRNTPIDIADVPVDYEYVKALQDLDLKVRMKSRWFNYALVEGEDVVAKVSDLSFVKRIELAPKYEVIFSDGGRVEATTMLTYGESANQIEMLNGNYLHDLGNLGQGMTIAVLDGGFTGANGIKGLDSLRLDGRLLGTYNFVDNDTNVFSVGNHGSDVLTVMAGFVDTFFVGSAYKANYWLLKSEDQSSETIAEMDNWLAAAEFADSVGADIITSSLGYNTFDGGVGDIPYSDLDGNTTLVTKAADMAAKKGILVIVSAGNEGNSAWKHILAPADGDSVMTIGGVDEFRNYVSFASQGPSADGRIKPDVSARASSTAYVSTIVRRGNGTSFSCPVVSGLAACFWQQYPTLTNMEVFEAIRVTASHYANPNNEIGYGIPNFAAASWTISNREEDIEAFDIQIYPNPVNDHFFVKLINVEHLDAVSIKLLDVTGHEVANYEFEPSQIDQMRIEAPEAHGAYIVSILIDDQVYLRKILK